MADLSAFTLYNNRSLGGIGAEEINTPQAQQMLQQLRQYDPNANFRPTYGSDGQLIGYTLDVDASKLPGASGTGSLGGTSGHGSGADYMPSFSTVQDNMHLADPNAVTQSPIYGKITDNKNIQQQNDIWSILGPLAVIGFGMAAPGMFGAYSALGGGGADLGAFGMADHGLGVAGGSGLDGTLSASQIADLGPMAQAAGVSSFAPDDYSWLMNGGLNGDAQLGSAESSLYGHGALTDPASALGGGTQAAAPIVDQGISAGIGDVIRNGGIPGLGNIARSIGDNLPNILSDLGKVPGIGGAGGGSGGGGGGLLAQPYNMQPYKSLTALLRQYGDRGLLG